MNLDNDLRRTFRRTPAPDDLADRVLARIGESQPAPASEAIKPRMSVRGWLAAAAVLTLMAVGGARYYLYLQTIAEAERVQAEIGVALQITVEKLALVQRKVEDSQR